MVGSHSITVEVPLLNYTANTNNVFNDITSTALLSPANANEVIVITGIESYFSSLYAFSPSNRPVVTQANSANLAITIIVGQDKVYDTVPYLSFCTLINYGVVKEIEPTQINLQKSSINVVGTLPDNTTSAIVNFWYDKYTREDYKKLQAAIAAYKLKYGRLDMSQVRL